MKTIWRSFSNEYRDLLRLMGLALLVGVTMMVILDDPGYTDAYYYYNAGERLATGDGLTDPYLWIYLRLPDELPIPSHTYWMPLASILSGASMSIFGANFTAAQLPSVLALAGLVGLTGWLGLHLGERRRYLWLSGFIVLFGGFFFPFWFTTDTFAIYGLVGAGALITMSIGRDWRWFAASGALTGLAHLSRADGVLLLLVALLLIWWQHNDQRWRKSVAVIIAYLVVMIPWFIRNINVIDQPLASGGINTAFLRGYNELFAYPVNWSATNFLDWGLNNILQSRWEALLNNLGTFIAVEGLVLVGPLALLALWKRRDNRFLTAFWLYGLALHLAMTFVFAYPGYRGGLFHSSAALMPFWAALGVLGLDDAIDKMVQWRRWTPHQAQAIFGTAILALAGFLALNALSAQLQNREAAPDYKSIADEYLPEDAVLMVNDPAAWYYHTGLTGVTLFDAPLERLPELANRYCLTHLILDENVTASFEPLNDGKPPPPFLEEITANEVRIYRIQTECPTD